MSKRKKNVLDLAEVRGTFSGGCQGPGDPLLSDLGTELRVRRWPGLGRVERSLWSSCQETEEEEEDREGFLPSSS